MNEEERKELESLVLQAQLRKNSCKILHDPKSGAVKSIEVKAYGRTDGHCDEAVIQAISMLCDTLERLKDENFIVIK